MSKESIKHRLEQLQQEFTQDAEALATLQNIYAEKVKLIRTNRAFPPDIQQRFLGEWEQFYDQRITEIFSYREHHSDHASSDDELGTVESNITNSAAENGTKGRR